MCGSVLGHPGSGLVRWCSGPSWRGTGSDSIPSIHSEIGCREMAQLALKGSSGETTSWRIFHSQCGYLSLVRERLCVYKAALEIFAIGETWVQRKKKGKTK